MSYIATYRFRNDIGVTCVCFHLPQVYQYMHETITVNGCPEYQARATAKVRAAVWHDSVCRMVDAKWDLRSLTNTASVSRDCVGLM